MIYLTNGAPHKRVPDEHRLLTHAHWLRPAGQCPLQSQTHLNLTTGNAKTRQLFFLSGAFSPAASSHTQTHTPHTHTHILTHTHARARTYTHMGLRARTHTRTWHTHARAHMTHRAAEAEAVRAHFSMASLGYSVSRSEDTITWAMGGGEGEHSSTDAAH